MPIPNFPRTAVFTASGDAQRKTILGVNPRHLSCLSSFSVVPLPSLIIRGAWERSAKAKSFLFSQRVCRMTDKREIV